VVAELGAVYPDEVLLAVAVHGTLEAAVSFDASRELAYEQWAQIFAAYRLWEQIRRAHGGDRPGLADIRRAMFDFMAHNSPFPRLWRVSTREQSLSVLRSYTDALLIRGVLAAHLGGITRGEQDVVETESARRAGDALRRVLAGLRPEQLALLQQCAAYGEPVAKAARESRKRYKTVLDEYHEVLALCAARLAGPGLGITEEPPWHPDVSGQVFEDPPEPSDE
jgi:hypothetical protein